MVYIFYLLSYLILFYFSSAFTFAPSCASPINTAEKVLRKSLQDKEAQMGMIDRMLDEVLTPNKN